MEVSTFFGILGVVANTIWPLVKRRKYLLLGQVIAATLMAIHFYLLNADTGAMVMLVAAFQASLAIPLESHPKFKSIYFASLILTPLVCWVTWQGGESIFSSLALALFCIGNLQLNTKLLRVFLILCIFGWVGHNIIVLSYPGLISNLLALSTSIFGLWREFMPNKASQNRALRALGSQ